MTTQAAVNTGALTRGLLQYRRMLYSFIYSLVRDVIATEELFQEVALIAIEKDRKADEEIREPAAWLRETARRLVVAGFRTSQGRLVVVESDYLEQVAQVFETETTTDYQHARLAALEQCLKRVSFENRDVLYRHYVLGNSYQEIGDAKQRTPGALRVVMHRVVRQLMGCIQQRLAQAASP